jgi:hypothetical protein
MVYFKVLSRSLPRGTKGNHRVPGDPKKESGVVTTGIAGAQGRGLFQSILGETEERHDILLSPLFGIRNRLLPSAPETS